MSVPDKYKDLPSIKLREATRATLKSNNLFGEKPSRLFASDQIEPITQAKTPKEAADILFPS